MEIPVLSVLLLGIGAVTKHAYQVFVKGSIKTVGALITTIYITLVYAFLSTDLFTFHGGSFVRIGIVILFLDKIIVFLYDLWKEAKSKKNSFPIK